MQKFIFRTFLTALLIYALDGAFAGPGEKEKEYEAERTFCSPRSILNEAKRILETNPRSLEAHLKFTKVARAWLNSEKKEEFDGARQALDRASEFMEDSRNDPRTRGRIAIEVAFAPKCSFQPAQKSKGVLHLPVMAQNRHSLR